jgi:tetratricopeptide (TPR) repeat protein
MGNTFLEQKKWDDAIKYFKQSLRDNPNSANTKYNLAYAQKMKQQQDQKDKDEKKEDEKKDKQQQDKQQDKKEQKEEPSKSEQQSDDQRAPEKPKPQPSKLTKEQAEQLLNALNQEEKKLKAKKDKGTGQPMKLEKDW